MSQPFVYIFAIIVIGLILAFGFKYIGKVLNTGCQVETITLVRDLQSEVNQVRSLSSSSSVQCVFSKNGNTGSSCEIILPDNVETICFVDAKKGQQNQIPPEFSDVKNFISEFGSGASSLKENLFFSTTKGASCDAEPVEIKNLKIDAPICLDVSRNENSIILENSGNIVTVTRS